MSQKYDKLKTLLKELFQLDQSDLNFGLYCVMPGRQRLAYASSQSESRSTDSAGFTWKIPVQIAPTGRTVEYSGE